MQSKTHFRLAVLGTLAPFFIPSGALAQVATEQVGVDEIIVTARRTEEDQQTTPVAVTAISAIELERAQVDTLQELMYAAPNLSVTSGGPGDANLAVASIRGQAQLDSPGTVDQPIGLYVDGVYLGRASGALLDLVDARQVEVLRGPQGTLFGRNTTGGAISITTQLPTGEFGGSLRGSFGNYERRDFTGIVNIPIAGEALAARLIFRHAEHEGYGENLFLGTDIGSDELDFYRFALRAAPEGASWNFVLTGDRTEREGSGQLQVLSDFFPTPIVGTLLGLAGLPGATLDGGGRSFTTRYAPGNVPRTSNPCAAPLCTLPIPSDTLADFAHGTAGWHENYANNQPFDELTTEGLSGTFTLDLGSMTFKSITGYRTLAARGFNDTDGTPWTLLNTLYDNRQHQFSEEIQMLGEAGNVDWIVGAFYFSEEGREKTTSENWSRIIGNTNALPGAFTARPTFNDSNLANESSAVYGQANIQLGDRWRGTVGLRQTWDSREIVLHNLSNATLPPTGANCVIPDPDPPGPASNGVCDQTLRTNFDYLSYTVGLDFQATEDIFFYLKHSRAYRSGGFNPRNGTPVANIPFRPEQVRDIEGGVKADWLDDRLRTNLAIFYAEYVDVQRPGNTVGGAAGVLQPAQYEINAGDAHVSGLEIEVTAAPYTGLELTASLGLTDAKYDTFSDARLGDRSGEDFPQTPETTWALGATQRLPMSFGEFVLHADYAFVGDQNFTPSLAGENAINPSFPVSLADAGVIEGYGLLNAQVSLELNQPSVEIALWGRNLTDEEYYVRKYSDLINLFGFASANVGDPLTYGVTLTYRFGQ